MKNQLSSLSTFAFVFSAVLIAQPSWAQCTTNASTGVTVGPSESDENSKSIHSANRGSQTFTVTGAGCLKLNQVTFSVKKIGSPANNLTVEIHDVSSGVPGTTILASKTGVVVAAGGYTDVTVTFDTPPEVSGGVQYALVVYTSSGNANNGYRLGLATGNPYAGGKYTKSEDSGATWTEDFGGGLDVRMSICVTPCAGGCVRSKGYWNRGQDWPVNSLDLGSVSYTQAELLLILNHSVGGNGLISHANQLIAAKLNVANGAAVPAGIAAAISAADAMIGGLVVPPIGSGFIQTSITDALNGTLDQYNNGLYAGGPIHCGE